QLEDGEFSTLVSSDRTMETECRYDSTPFTTALVMHSLGFVDSASAREMRDRGARFLLQQREGPGLWRFWTTKNQQRKFIPPDLDDTGCAAFALKAMGLEFVSNIEVMLANRNQQGLFYTWLLPRRTVTLSGHYWVAALARVPFAFPLHPF